MVSTPSSSSLSAPSSSRTKTRSSVRHLEDSTDSYRNPPSPLSLLPNEDSTNSSENPTVSPTPFPISSGHNPTPEQSTDSDLEQLRSALSHSKVFLGNPDITQHVEWIEAGRQQVLVLKEETEGRDRDPAVLEWIGEISPSNYWLYACAGWNGERGPDGSWSRESPFEKAKARGQVRRPIDPLLSREWDACIANMERLMDMAKNNLKSPTALSTILANEIKIRHSIFEPKYATDDSGSFSDDEKTVGSNQTSELGPEFSIENMSCKFPKATEALERIKDDGLYDFSPLPVMTDDGKPIQPNDYERKLLGATALVRITLSSDFFPTKGYQYYADINSITILRRPRVVTGSPHVKSPSKRSRFDLPDHVKRIKRKI